MSRVFSTRELAQMWNVSESTIKRWADAGTLPCARTPGGHRRFLLEHIRDFQATHGFKATGLLKMRHWEEPEEPEAATESADVKLKNLFRTALNNRRSLLLEQLQKVYLRGLTLSELYDQLILPLDRRVREQQADGRLSLAQAQLICNNLEDALHRLLADAVWRPPNGCLGLCGALDPRRPLALNGVSRMLEAEGWDCLNLGAGLGFEQFAEMVRQEPVNVVCIVAASRPKLPEAALAELTQETDAYQIPVLLTGTGFDRAFTQNFSDARIFPDFAALQRFLDRATPD